MILITGCAGFIGFHLAKKLLINKKKVIGIDCINNYYPRSKKYQRLKIIKKYDVILNKNPNTKFLIIGGGFQFNRLESLIKEKNLNSNIILTGFLPQQVLPEYLSLADICIQPFETNYVTNRILPSKILEYFACGKAVLSTPLKGTVEILPDESFGITYATQNIFVEKLSELLSNEIKLEELGRQGYDYVIQNHDLDVLSKKIIEKFESVKSKF